MLDPAELKQKGTLDLSNMLDDWENKIQAAIEVEYQHKMELRVIAGKILELRKQANDLNSGMESSRNVRQKLESEHRVIKNVFWNLRNNGQ